TNSLCLSDMNSDRTRRAAGGQDTAVMAAMIDHREGLNTATMTTARASCGMVWKNSVKRIRRSSSHPPKYPESVPTRMPKARAMAVETMPTSKETRAPHTRPAVMRSEERRVGKGGQALVKEE